MTTIEKLPAGAAGVALWRQIADVLREQIVADRLPAGAQLPTEAELAGRYGVNRHTVRAALRALRDDGVVRAVQGSGTFVASVRRLSYRIGERTRFHDALAGQASALRSELLEHRMEPADPAVAAALGMPEGSEVLVLETLSHADGRPLSRATHWLPAGRRFAGIERALDGSGSLTRALAAFGVTDYLRRSTIISARPAAADEAKSLDLAPGAVVLVSDGIDAEPSGGVIQRVVSRFAAVRVELLIKAD